MRPHLEKVERRLSDLSAPAIALVIWTFLISALAIFSKLTGVHLNLCSFRALSGLPCPSCGSTRGVLRILGGDILGGVLMNPLMMIALVVIGVGFALRLCLGLRIRWNLGRGDRWVLGALAVGAVAANWIWIIHWHATQ